MMHLPRRRSLLWIIGFFLAGSIALGYDYLFVYDPPIRTVERFESAMGWGDVEAVKSLIVMSTSVDLAELRDPTDAEVRQLLIEPFDKGRILDLRQRVDDKGTYHYVVVRGTDAQIYAFIVTRFNGRMRVIVSERRTGAPMRYLWEYNWAN
jgi:hypothetical protein